MRPSLGRAFAAALASCLVLAVAGTTPVSAAEVAGVKVPDSADVGGRSLFLNGAGVRSKFFVKVYVGALYLHERTSNAGRAINARGPRRITLHFLHKEIGADQITEAWQEGFDGNLSSSEKSALGADIKAFKALWPAVKRGDVAHVDVVPGGGTSVTINGKQRGTVSNEKLGPAVVAIWLGDKPADKGLKKAMLGG